MKIIHLLVIFLLSNIGVLILSNYLVKNVFGWTGSGEPINIFIACYAFSFFVSVLCIVLYLNYYDK